MIDFTLTEEQKLLQESAREFAITNIIGENQSPPRWRRLREKRFPWDIYNMMVNAGYAGATIPEEYGGGGLDQVSFAILAEEICRADAGVGLSVGASLMLVADPIFQFGTDEQKDRWLPVIAAGAIGAYAQTESGAGSDISAIRTKGEIQGDEMVITGEKMFITNGNIADVILAVVRTSGDPHKGLTMVLVNARKAKRENTLTAPQYPDKIGLHSSPTTSLVFQECRVPLSNVLGKIGNGFRQATATLTGSRPFIGAQGVGLAQAALDCALAHVTRREQFGKKLAELHAVQHELAEMEVLIQNARLLVYKAAHAVDTTPVEKREKIMGVASAAKLHAARAATFCALKSLVLHGGMGFMAESRISAIYQDVPILHVYEGTENIQLGIIARQILEPFGVKVRFNN
ncbi:MAG: acyl-CoA dehydrogenase family protein [Parcubacteria group bacterium]|nr:acyl-CoA dehydrogenase family protein [Parcubacteria group bacterium]